MKTISSLYFLIITVVLVGSIRLQAQSSSFTFSCASWERIDGDPIHYLAGKPKVGRGDESSEDRMKRLKEIDVPQMTRSLGYEFKSGRTIGFFRKSTNAEGEVTLKAIATTTVPSDWKKVLFVFFPAKTKGAYRVYSLRDDRGHVPFGSYQFVNLTDARVTGFLNKKRIDLQPQKTSIISLTGNKSRPINFGVWNMVNGKRQWLQRNTLTYKPTKYLIYFFYSEKDRWGKLKLESKGIVAFKPPPVPTERERASSSPDE